MSWPAPCSAVSCSSASGPGRERPVDQRRQPLDARHGEGFELLGSTDLGNRGLNSPLAVAGRCAYVGDRDYTGTPRKGAGVAGRRRQRPDEPHAGRAHPGRPGRHPARAAGRPRARAAGRHDLRHDRRDHGQRAPDLRHPGDCTKPRLLSTFDFGVRPPHEFFLVEGPEARRAGRSPTSRRRCSPPTSRCVDLTDPTAPSTAHHLRPRRRPGRPDRRTPRCSRARATCTRSSVSDDGTRAYMGTWDYGTYVADTSLVADPSVPAARSIVPLGAAAGSTTAATSTAP